MAKMQFEEDGEGKPTKIALGMYSKEEEYVPFNQPCDCTGQVRETWKLCPIFKVVVPQLPMTHDLCLY